MTRNINLPQENSNNSTYNKEFKGSIDMFNRELETNMNIIENKQFDEEEKENNGSLSNVPKEPLNESLGSSINSEKNKVDTLV
mmetsp:Transcript_19270/g.18409  ORF Transcript_19270/g.18409 Transcript_19270/m.18409 type:complete len:83 (+) Transcript_19270:64-312(+)